ncbi:hypothetical protein M153_8800013837 [Pseudoloma neurophilia]|uniref:DUF8032 domain-containing protein n=1 Tax=Pseudoloma neurophilia TaxID=146866 RepID=A0A0R0M0M1_9MICR|nr:hypothetical protein M153_8800013837 [Pseudoloma neurophilia]
MSSTNQYSFQREEFSQENNDHLNNENYDSLSIQNMLLDENHDYNNLMEENQPNFKKSKKEKGSKPIDRKRRREEKSKIQQIQNKPLLNRRIVNLPASQPYIRIIDGEERLCFKYNTKISEKALNAMPRNDLADNEFCVRFDLENVDITKLNEKFKIDNCVYPRANVPFEMYTGNRWEYETECNMLAWQFVSLNPILLYGKKGLIQRAVDSYRNINKQSRNKKIIKQDHLSNLFKRRHSDHQPKNITINWSLKNINRKCKIRIDIENIEYDKIDIEFKIKYSVYTDEFDDLSFGLTKWESTNPDNILAVKIAFLNLDNTTFWNAIKATDKAHILKKAVDGYKNRSVEGYISDEDEDKIELSDIVLDTLNKVYDDKPYSEGNFQEFDTNNQNSQMKCD